MAISVTCVCGKAFSTKDENAGRKTKCPKCGNALVIPTPAVEVLDDPFIDPQWRRSDGAEAKPTPPPQKVAKAEPAKPRVGSAWKAALWQRRRTYAIGGIVGAVVAALVFLVPWENPEYQGKKFTEWKRQLGDLDPQVKASAIAAIGGIGKNGHPALAISTLGGVINGQQSAEIRRMAVQRLVTVAGNDDAPTSTRIVKTLLAALRTSDDARVSREILKGIYLKMQSVEHADVFDGVKGFLARTDAGGKEEAMPILMELAASSDKALSAEAVALLGKAIEDDETVDEAISALYGLASSTEGSGKCDLNPIMPRVVIFVTKRFELTSRLSAIQYNALQILKKAGKPEVVVPVLISFVGPDYHPLQHDAITALGEIGPPARDAIPVLRRYISSGRVTEFEAEEVQRVISRIQTGR